MRYKGVIQKVSTDGIDIRLIGGNQVRVPYHQKYSHMRQYETVWVFTDKGKVTELHTLECIEKKHSINVSQFERSPDICPELVDIEESEEVVFLPASRVGGDGELPHHIH